MILFNFLCVAVTLLITSREINSSFFWGYDERSEETTPETTTASEETFYEPLSKSTRVDEEHGSLYEVTTPKTAVDQEYQTCYSCASCSQVRICHQTREGFIEAFRFSCTGSKPFCDGVTGTCTSTPSTECADTGKLTCLRDGMFPDLERCDEYHLCQQGVSRTFHCKEGEVFDGHMCSKDRNCQTFDCRNMTGAKVSHPNNPAVFAYCLHGRPLFVDRCGEHEELDQVSQKCRASWVRVEPKE